MRRERMPCGPAPESAGERSQEAFVHVPAGIIEVGKKTENLI
jgi:hypothetical protein